jgi:hypothetical protein
MTAQRDSPDVGGDADVETGLGALLQPRIYRGEFGAAPLEEANDYSADVIACTRDICTYIYETHGRFPAHTDTIHVPGVWLQTHHLENAYYEKYFRNGMTEAHELHDQRWHRNGNG